jgi:hypothetical protein
LALALAFSLFLVAGSAGAIPPDSKCEVHAKPSIGMSCGDHKLDLSLETRYRAEYWDAYAAVSDWIHGLRTRVGLKYSFRDLVSAYAEFQDTRIYSLSPNSSGAGGLYYAFGGFDESTSAQDMRQYWLDIQPIKGLSLRGGRQDIKLGTQALYPEANWKYLKVKRTSQRLVGTVGWTNVERSNDAATIAWDTEGYHVYGFAGKPTTGVFDTQDAYETQSDIVYGGVSATAKRGTWVDNTEFRAFFIGYGDDRSPSEGNAFGDMEIYTLGFSVIGVYPVGPGNFDAVLWAAGQAGDFGPRDHLAGALVAEAGYQFTEVYSKPWLRTGVNVASGGGASGDHNTFHNLLPTNHLYYGFADVVAFQNLVDVFAQLQFKPHERVAVNLMFHQFYLANDNDMQYFGSGAFNEKMFGYGGNPSGGDTKYAKELDVIVNVNLCKGFSVQSGYAHIWGDDVVDNLVSAGTLADDQSDFAYVQFTLKY